MFIPSVLLIASGNDTNVSWKFDEQRARYAHV